MFEHVERGADVDHHVLLGERLAEESDVDHEGGAVHLGGRPEERIGQAVGNHDPVTDLNGEHGSLQDVSVVRVADNWGKTVRTGCKDLRQAPGRIVEVDLFRHQRIECRLASSRSAASKRRR